MRFYQILFSKSGLNLTKGLFLQYLKEEISI